MSDAWIAAMSAFATGLLSLLGVYIANRRSATLIEYQIKELRDKVEEHNKWGDRITILETQISGVTKSLDEIKKKVSA